MNRTRSLSVALALQVLALLALTQTWYTISMTTDGNAVALGSYDGASAYPVATPLALLGLAAISVVAISAGKTRLVAISISAVSAFAALALIVPLWLSQDVSALDTELDRLTGIANTHGLQDLGIAGSAMSFAWMALTALTAIFSSWMIVNSRNWVYLDRGVSSNGASASKKPRPKSAIDIWDEQRE